MAPGDSLSFGRRRSPGRLRCGFSVDRRLKYTRLWRRKIPSGVCIPNRLGVKSKVAPSEGGRLAEKREELDKRGLLVKAEPEVDHSQDFITDQDLEMILEARR